MKTYPYRQYKKIFFAVKNFVRKNETFHVFAQNIDCGYKFEPPGQGGSNEYPQAMFWSKNKKNCIPLQTPVKIKVGY